MDHFSLVHSFFCFWRSRIESTFLFVNELENVFFMPAPKTIFIPHSCFGYYDEKFSECTRKCRIAESCRNATNSPEYEEVRKVYKYLNSQIDELAEKWKSK